MRQSRAPTASQIQSPPPPASSTKSGRFFGKANIGTSCNYFALQRCICATRARRPFLDAMCVALTCALFPRAHVPP